MSEHSSIPQQWPRFPDTSREEWKTLAAKSAPNKNPDGLGWITPDDIFLKALYTQDDIAKLPFTEMP